MWVGLARLQRFPFGLFGRGELASVLGGAWVASFKGIGGKALALHTEGLFSKQFRKGLYPLFLRPEENHLFEVVVC
jgi:hypothetical protein